ncbi:MAG: serine kinase [Chloroflexi bacterium]|nr:serine kinase [Chloroflexota bacterium]
MTLQEIIAKLNLTVLTTPRDFSTVTPQGGYASDLLSCVMAGAQPDNVWVTLQAHMNVVAVAALREVAAVIITENAQPEPDVIAKANDQNVTLLSTSAPSYEVVGRLWEMGIR